MIFCNDFFKNLKSLILVRYSFRVLALPAGPGSYRDRYLSGPPVGGLYRRAGT